MEFVARRLGFFILRIVQMIIFQWITQVEFLIMTLSITDTHFYFSTASTKFYNFKFTAMVEVR